MKIDIEKRNKFKGDTAHRYNHDGFEVGSKWRDIGDGGVVVTVVGPGIAGMPEVEGADGGTYFAHPTRLTQEGI